MARLAQSAERKALSLVVVGSCPTVGVLFSLGLACGDLRKSWAAGMEYPRWTCRPLGPARLGSGLLGFLFRRPMVLASHGGGREARQEKATEHLVARQCGLTLAGLESAVLGSEGQSPARDGSDGWHGKVKPIFLRTSASVATNIALLCGTNRSYGVTASTLDSESSDRGSNPRRTFQWQGGTCLVL